VKYNYRVGKKSYQGDKIIIDAFSHNILLRIFFRSDELTSFVDLEQAKEFGKRFHEGRKVDVFYSKTNPHQAVLIKFAASQAKFLTIVMDVILLVLVGGFALYLWKFRNVIKYTIIRKQEADHAQRISAQLQADKNSAE